MMMTAPVPVAIRLAAMNCDDPANTNTDIASAPVGERPLVVASAPKMMPNGMAPTTSGKVAFMPAQNSPRRVGWVKDCMLLSYFRTGYRPPARALTDRARAAGAW